MPLSLGPLGLGLTSSLVGYHGPTVPAVPTFLPTVSVAPSAVYGTSKLISAYAGPAGRTQRLSDDVEADVAFGSKFADVSGIGLGTHQWKAVYDQTGNANHITMATKVNQPSASNLTYRGCPAVHFDSSDLAIDVRAKWAACSTGPVTEKSAFTMFLLIAPTHSFNDNYYTSQPDTATTLSLFTQTTNVGIRGNNTSPFNSTRKMPRIQPHVLTWMGSTAGKTFGINESEQIVSTAPAAGTVTGISFGHHISTASFDGKYDLLGAVVYNAALSLADRQAVRTALYAQCNVLTSASNLIIFDGDSRTQGAGRTLNETWEKKLLDGTGKTIHAINMGVGGQTLSTMAGAVAARVNALYDATYTKNIVVNGAAGINDFTANRTAVLQVIPDMQTWAAGLHANQQLIVATCPLRDTSTGPQNTERQTYNTWLRANYASLKAGTQLVDIDALFPTWNSTDYIDVVHFKDAGQTKWAAAFQPAIEAIAV